ncbi:MAG: HAMP domain-containing histidine kinase [Chitinophagaceae bacterium]|nr:HAMP domain-containing histidine kinase [Chitinophagaceae bacterium]MBL0333784.1 HAMP domain-containing histidine kinase [Chitinophagaceae bacterium]
MRSTTTRIFIVTGSILIAVIIGVQVHWLKKTYAYEENEFNTSVLKSIRGLYEDMDLSSQPGDKLMAMVQRPDLNTYLFKVERIPVEDSLVHYLRTEFDDFRVFADCQIGTVPALAGSFAYQFSLNGSGAGDGTKAMPVARKEFNYIILFFPARGKYIIGQMNRWIFTSGLLILLLIGFASAIYYFFKQKFLVEVQQDFINNVTHEFSTPLSVIDLSVEGLEKPTVTGQPDKYNKYLKAIKYQSDYLKNHIGNLMSTVVAGKYHFEINKKQVVPNEMLKKVVMQLEPLLTRKNGTIEWNLEPDDCVIMADEENLFLALFNIVSNAIKYSETPKIIVATYRQDAKFCISIKDNGLGIEQGQLKNIFRKFYRVQDGNIHNVKGLGLGLYFTRKVVDGHKGNIVVNSIPKIGTEFRIELPGNNLS